ncbi:MAG: ATP-binding protein [Bacteroidota bacterium]
MKDQNGFLWISGQSIDRYDGYDFVKINERDTTWKDYYLDYKNSWFSENYICHRLEDKFYLRSINTGKNRPVDLKAALAKRERLFKDFIFHETPNGSIYFPAFDPSTQKTTFLSLEEGTLKRKFYRTDLDTIGLPDRSWLSSDTKGNLYYRNLDKSHFIKINANGKQLQKIPSPTTTKDYSLIKSGINNVLYLVFQNEIYYLKENALHFEPHPINQHLNTKCANTLIKDLLELPNGDLWVCGTDRKLVSYSKTTGKVNDYQDELFDLISHRSSLLQLVSDQTNIVWVRVQQLGILKVIPQQSLFDTYFTDPECEGFCSFRGMTENEKGQIFASFYYGISQINPATKTAQNVVPHLNQYGPFGLGYHDGHLLLNSGRRLNLSTGQLDPNFPLLPTYNSDEGAMVQDASGNWWNAFEQYIWFYDANAEKLQWEKKFQIPVEVDKNTCLHYSTKKNGLWVANRHRLFFIDISNNTLTKYFKTVGKEVIHAIYEDEKGNVWLGTEEGFVFFNAQNKRTKIFKTKNGLPHNFVASILPEGDSCLWLGTNSGLSRFQIDKETFTNFYVEHGLSDNEFNRISAYKSKNGQLFFGGIRGINAFYPQELMQKYQKQQNIGKVMLSSISHFNEKLDSIFSNAMNWSTNQLEYFHGDKSMVFEFCLTDYRTSTKNQFSYLLEGYDKIWSTPSKYNFAKYNHLPAGDYVFRVKAFDAKGYWNPNELAIPIKVYPPWWQTSWAYCIYAFFLGGLVYGVYRFIKYRLALESQFQFEQKEAQRLKDLDAFKSRLFTNLTHEFRTPLTVMLGMTTQVAKGIHALRTEGNAKSKLLSQTQLIEQNGESLLHLVNQLLDLSKLKNGAYPIHLQHKDVLPFLSYTVSSFQIYANQQNLALKFSSTQEVLKMDFDPTLLQQVIINLISNALKFTRSGGSIFVKVDRLQKSKQSFLQIKVQDTGIGIPTEKLPHIFNRFFQVDGSTTRDREGTGIGLAHTKELIDLMEGQIEVQSTLDEGTTFWVQLPIKDDLSETETKPINSMEGEFSPFKFASSKKRIDKIEDHVLVPRRPDLLLIEDNSDLVTYLKTCLDAHYQIEVAYNGKVGIEKALQSIPDLIISDIMMPEKDGYEVCKVLKHDEKTSHIPIVLLTAKADAASKIDGFKSGADAYLSKPFHQEELLVRLQSLLKRQERLVQYFSKQSATSTFDALEKETSLPTASLQVEHAFIQKVENILEKHYADKDFSLNHLCQKIGMSRSQLFRKMKAIINTSPSQFIRSYRLQKAKTLLETTELNVSEVVWATGFSSLPHFSRIFLEEFGVPPSKTTKHL